MGVQDVTIIGVGKDEYNSSLDGMIDGRILPWVEDSSSVDYPVWDDYGAVQRSAYFLNREGDLIHQFNLTSLTPSDPEDYEYLMDLILDYRAENGPNIIRVPEDTTTIQGGIDLAQDGDIVLVSDGLFQENITYHDKNLTVATLLFTGTDQHLQDMTIIDGTQNGSVVTINGGQNETSILLGFVIQNGWATVAGGGIYIEDANPTIDRNIILNNHAGECGGSGAGIAVLNESSPLIIGNQIHGNEVSGYCDCICYFGGGIYVDSTSFPAVGGSITHGNIFGSNSADHGYDLYRTMVGDSASWTPIMAHYNSFENCPPVEDNVFPSNGWDVENCQPILGADDEQKTIPYTTQLFPNYPNPFNSTTTIEFFIDSPKEINLNIIDIKGRIVDSKKLKLSHAGHYKTMWDASGKASGVYFIRLHTVESVQTQKVLFVQ